MRMTPRLLAAATAATVPVARQIDGHGRVPAAITMDSKASEPQLAGLRTIPDIVSLEVI